MERYKKYFYVTLVLLIASVIWIWTNHQNIQELESTVYYQDSLIDEYSDALDEANDNIDEANSMIEDAQWYAWESYEEMGEALEDLDTVGNVSDPWF